MASITFSGVGSGIDTRAIIEAILNAERAPVRRLQSRVQGFEAEKSALEDFRGKLDALESTIVGINNLATLSGRLATVPEDAPFTAIANPDAVAGQHDVEVLSLAKAHRVRSDGFADRDQPLVSDGTLTIQAGSADPITVDVSATEGNNTLDGVRDAINAADGGARASVIFDGSEYVLVVTSEETGTAEALTITDSTNLNLDGPASEIQAAADAQVVVDGVTVDSGSNRISGAVEGITLDLVGLSTAGPTVLTVENDTESVKEALGSFVESYNELVTFLDEKASLGSEGPLAGNATVRRLTRELQSLLTRAVPGQEGEDLRSLSSVGLAIDRSGQLSIETSRLDDILETNFDGLRGLLLKSGRASDAAVRFASSSNATVPGEYAVTITSAAEQAKVTGQSAIDPSGINKDETLTIDLNGDSFQVALLQNDTLADIVGKINAAAGTAGVDVEALDEGGFLSIRSTAFGSSQTLDVVSDRNAQPAGKTTGIGTTNIVDAGGDLAGTIGGFAATADGDTLTGADGTDVEGLSIRVNATAATVAAKGGDFGTVTFSRGAMELLEETLEDFTDRFSGPIQAVAEGLDNSIERLELSIERFEDRLARREVLLVRQFQKVESAVAVLQSQQAFLGSGGGLF